MGIEVIICGYGLVCLSMLVFNLLYSAYLRSGERRSAGRTDRLATVVEPVLDSGTLPEEHLARMGNLLARVSSLLALDEYLGTLPPERAEGYLRRIAPLFPHLADTYQKREEIQGAYFCRFLASWGGALEEERRVLAPKAAQFIRRKSFYSRVNALKALCTLGQADVLLDALKWLTPSEQEGLSIHEKVIVEALLSFNGDTHGFITSIWSRLERFSIPTQRVLLDYIRFQSGDYKDNLLNILLDEDRDKELRFSAIRYFGRYPDERARATLLRFVSDRDPVHWEYAAIAASSLAKYPGSDTTSALTAALSSPNWYVRYNCASSLEQLGFTYEDLLGTAAFDDRYAREMLTYRLEMRQVDAQRGETKEAAAV